MSSPRKTRSRRHLEIDDRVPVFVEIPESSLARPIPRTFAQKKTNISGDTSAVPRKERGTETSQPTKTIKKYAKNWSQTKWSSLTDFINMGYDQTDRIAALEDSLVKSEKKVEKLKEENGKLNDKIWFYEDTIQSIRRCVMLLYCKLTKRPVCEALHNLKAGSNHSPSTMDIKPTAPVIPGF